GLRILTFMGAVFESSDYLDCIAPENISDASLLAAWEALSPRQSDAGADLVILANTLPDARINRLAPSLFPNRRYDKRRTSVCPYLPLPDNEESLFKQLSKNMKSTLRRTRNKINKDPRFTIDRVEDPDELDESVQNLFTLHNMRFTDKGQATKFNYEQRGAFHKRIAAVWLKQDRLRFYRVLYDDSAIGYLYCYYHNNTILYMQAGFHPDYGKYGLGNQLMLRAMNEGMENGAVEFDFMRGNESYKYKWTSLFRELFTTRIALTSRGARLLLKDALLTHIKQFIRQFIPKK
ncbi:MAG: GNAT family N-acetyltransferase, partial [Calditrichaeota bacterium]